MTDIKKGNTITKPADAKAAAAEQGKVVLKGKVVEPEKGRESNLHEDVNVRVASLEKENAKLREELALKKEKHVHNGVEMELPGAILFGKADVIVRIKKQLLELSNLTGVSVADLSIKAGCKSNLEEMEEKHLEQILDRLREFTMVQANTVRTKIRQQMKLEDKKNGAY